MASYPSRTAVGSASGLTGLFEGMDKNRARQRAGEEKRAYMEGLAAREEAKAASLASREETRDLARYQREFVSAPMAESAWGAAGFGGARPAGSMHRTTANTLFGIEGRKALAQTPRPPRPAAPRVFDPGKTGLSAVKQAVAAVGEKYGTSTGTPLAEYNEAETILFNDVYRRAYQEALKGSTGGKYPGDYLKYTPEVDKWFFEKGADKPASVDVNPAYADVVEQAPKTTGPKESPRERLARIKRERANK